MIKVSVETQHPLRSPKSRNSKPTDEVGDQMRKNDRPITVYCRKDIQIKE